MVSGENEVDDVKLRIFTSNGKTHTRIALRQQAELSIVNDSNETLSVTLDTMDALMLHNKPVDRFEVRRGERVCLTVNPEYPVGNSFRYTATVAGCEDEDPIIIIER